MQRLSSALLLSLVLRMPAASAEIVEPAKSPVLDVFPSGPWAGMNAVFQAKNFDATLDKERVLRIQPKLDGKNVGPPVLVRFNAYFSRDGSSLGRTLISLEKRPAPAMQPRKVAFAGQYDQKIKFTCSIEFSERGVTIEGDVKDPPVIKYPTVFAYAAYFSATHQIPADTSADEIKQLTEGHTVKFTDAKRQSQTMQFWEVIKSQSNAVATGEVSGPWGSRRVIVDMPATPRNGRRIGNYGNYVVAPFYKGGWWFSRGATDKVEGGPLTVKVE
jgi:hypothetical protein